MLHLTIHRFFGLRIKDVMNHISAKDLTVLKPWFSGRGRLPGRIDITTSKPKTKNRDHDVAKKNLLVDKQLEG